MANTARVMSENRYAVEIDGIPPFRSTKVTGGSEKHEAVKSYSSNEPRPRIGRGNTEPGETNITIQSGLFDNAIKAFSKWARDFNNGTDVTCRSGRYITYDETGRTPIETHELLDCIPIEVKPDDKSSDGKNAATVTVTILPSETRLV